tara:strand:- start:23 stop:721 length:699 start_codon:yes stop_codon:yes gene_type:complete
MQVGQTFKIAFLFLLLIFCSPILEGETEVDCAPVGSIYEELDGASKPDFELFEMAYLGYIDLKLSGLLRPDKEILSIIDFRLPSNQKRFWVIDIKNKEVLYNTLVAHGENSGEEEYALSFSNKTNSHQSSLGFYRTEETYYGKNGLSLRLQGLERRFNSNARERYVVLHGADYATQEYLDKHGKLGNSEGCPAIPMGIHTEIIKVTKGGTCLFIYFPDLKYIEGSDFMLEGY